MSFQLPKLSYSYDALEPYIDEATMHLHHEKHHQAYVDNLNKALEKYPELQKKSIEELLKNIHDVPEDIRQVVINHGGGHANHSFFWTIMSPKGGGKPKGELADAINKTFGDFQKFREEFSNKAMAVFGSGWAFLIKTPDGKLQLKRHSFQNSPLMQGNMPILGLDVWEHAYYLKYQNRRVEYIEAFWNVVNWEEANKLLLK
ncbi:superoxide dismutase [Candidatus Woesebacteria bacterium RIFCSPHIGHO2_01_FULL_44_21]|uniref:Superoxide dismutase n=1 Tax=Candidatus Woesebacteria bacterium RIFCSPHIGHO2_01_FULL_44_21 TaxID=1802503 RepID=A0A1F7Z350_9BACT|nr:MAG: superoxide dismutase [Candidatus Woesebacteria bacterium RIFCSPHIGHO2_01_FULL_44_21]OGM69460.1 MAG: superoxide dismutase [Candidatus Woesebacteria bacterium RIFCSPLOWO2_01_FULL_44_24b]